MAAYAAIIRAFAACCMVPSKDYPGLALQLVGNGVSHDSVLRANVSRVPELLSGIGMKAGQAACLLHWLDTPLAASGSAAVLPQDADAAALVALKSLLRSAGVIPAKDHEQLALLLMQEGVADECGLRASLHSTPPAFALESVITKWPQRDKILEFLSKKH
jgi:hypothetical protein